MKKGSIVKIIKKQERRDSYQIENKVYLAWLRISDKEFHTVELKVGNTYEVIKSRGVKGPFSGFIEVKCDVTGRKTLVLKEDVEEIQE